MRAGDSNVDTGAPVPWDARFRIGSLTKPFVATVLQLVGEDRLSLDDTVEELLPGLVHGSDDSVITVLQLLQHTSGLPEYLSEMPYLFDQAGFEKGRFDTVTSRQAVRLAMRNKPDFPPGTSWSYSNTGYRLAGMIIEKVTGHSWQSEVRRRIVRPLDLDQTTLPGTRSPIPGPHARGYERFAGPGATAEDPQCGEAIDATRQNPSWGGAAGEIISATRDTNRFLGALVRGQLLGSTELAEMQHTVPTNDSFRSNWPGARYGLGLMWIPNSCGGYWSHGGDIMGFMTRNGVTRDGRRSERRVCRSPPRTSPARPSIAPCAERDSSRVSRRRTIAVLTRSVDEHRCSNPSATGNCCMPVTARLPRAGHLVVPQHQSAWTAGPETPGTERC